MSLDFIYLHTTPKFMRRLQHTFMVGLTHSFNSKHNIYLRPKEKTCFISKLPIVKYFGKLKFLCDIGYEI
jgi:hypothetical protein